MKKWLCVFIVILLLSGCWDNAEDQAEEREKEDALAESITDEPGDIIKTLPYPTGISWISDIYADSATNTFWLLGESAVTEIHLIQINSQTGEVIDSINFNDAPFFLNHASELTWDGTSFWITSYGWESGVLQSFIYKINSSGDILETLSCPASETGGLCEGITWDGDSLWSGSSDNMDIVRFSQNELVELRVEGVLDSLGTRDVSYDSASNAILVSHANYLYFLNLSNLLVEKQVYTTFSRVGDWDGELYWAVNNSTLMLEGIYTGF